MFFSEDSNKDFGVSVIKMRQPISNRNISSILNTILLLAAFLFFISLIHFLSINDQSSNTPVNTATVINKSNKLLDVLAKKCYYDYDCYSKTGTSITKNRRRRFFYIDLGCFDGRDIDYFLHFFQDQILKSENLSVIAFEPDPINFSACKSTQERYGSVIRTVNNAAAWTEDGEVRYAIEKGQKSKIDQHSALKVHSIDFSEWLKENFYPDDYVYVKFTVEGAEIPILEKLVRDETLALIDHMEIEWHDDLSSDLEPRRVALECMFDSFGMDFLYMINPVDLRHTYKEKKTFDAVPKDRGWKLKDPLIRFYYRTRKDIPDLITERLKQKHKNVLF